jgi:hypothetical protein
MIDDLVSWYLTLFLENRPDRLVESRESLLAQDVGIKAVLDRRLQLGVWVHGPGADRDMAACKFVIRLERGCDQKKMAHKKLINFGVRAVGGPLVSILGSMANVHVIQAL